MKTFQSTNAFFFSDSSHRRLPSGESKRWTNTMGIVILKPVCHKIGYKIADYLEFEILKQNLEAR